ncbi:RsmE family RNA methyltransferase [Acanthopleuribacter pedis]|uniref:Ribosomal RNA small subunit methyltransferase E n=1 Tax=Acanthopleuribacter pedis TaxID=442870 RepID=A0A8J7QAK1_9BACT|nr:RsmE family RNA methyltransferase [Acanthopleuribacter pedis]MBO1320892.1 16S rRNA (uracil(1498)-N(3))-methyltransferase [Acanthopleuribacter pedis]
MKRLLVDSIPSVGTVFPAPTDEAFHLVHVLRAKQDEAVEVLDGRGGVAQGRIHHISKRTCDIEIEAVTRAERESPLWLGVVAALPVQRNTFDSLLPGLVQLGVNHVALVQTAFGGRLKKDRDKYQKRLADITRQSLKQCGRLFLPEISLGATWPETLGLPAADEAMGFLFHPYNPASSDPASSDPASSDPASSDPASSDPASSDPASSDPASKAADAGRPHRVWLAFGPEGGFSDEEAAEAHAAGWTLQSMGPRILKMETAVIGAAYWAQARWGDGLGNQDTNPTTAVK